jgi:hypothetical protein
VLKEQVPACIGWHRCRRGRTLRDRTRHAASFRRRAFVALPLVDATWAACAATARVGRHRHGGFRRHRG